LIPMALVLVAAAIIVLYAYERVAQDVVKQRDTELARISAARLSESLSRYSEVLRSAAAQEDIQSLEPNRLRSGLEKAQIRLYGKLFVFDRGVVIYNSEGVALWSQPFTAERQGRDFPITSKFDEMRKTLRPAFSDIFKDAVTGEDVILVGVPILKSDGEFKGVLAGMITLRYSFLGGMCAKLLELKAGHSGYAYLVDGNGRVIYHRHSSQVGTSLTSALPVMQATRGETGAVLAQDSVGESVISAFAPVPGTDDLVDVNYSVKEQPTGSLSASVGFSQNSGVILGANISENNFFGTGKRVSLGVNVSGAVKSANVSYMDPYYTVDGVSRGYSVFARKTDFAQQYVTSYLLDEYGGRLTFGYPTDNITRLNFGLGYTLSRVKDGAFSSREVTDFINTEGDSFSNYFLFGSWRRSTLNRGVLPSDGYSHSVSLDVSVPGSDLTFYKLSHKTDFYFPLTENNRWVLRTRTDIGYGDGYGSRSLMPFYEHFYAGGYGSVRGYQANSLGRRATNAPNDFSAPDPFGGNLLTEGSLELIFPTPFAGDTRSMRTAFFLDAGQVFDTDRGFRPELRAVRLSAGIGFQWITAVGPLAFSLAKPLNDKPGDNTQIFQFSLGQTF
ncbi:hypothetical protein LCGC14_0917240, partial [marine sediment metagenome]